MNKLLSTTCFIFCAESSLSMESKEEFNPSKVENFAFPGKYESYQDYVGEQKKPYESYKPFDIQSLDDLKRTVWYLFDALELCEYGYVRSYKAAVECIKKIEDEEILKKTLFMALEPDKRWDARSDDAAAECIKKIENQKILEKALLQALEPGNYGSARSHDAAIECIKKIGDQKILEEALFMALEPDNMGWARSNNAAFECIKKIDNKKILEKALLKALEPDNEGWARSDGAAIECIKKIDNESVIRDAFVLAMQTQRDGEMRSPYVSEEIFALRRGVDPIITDEELVTLYHTNQNAKLRNCIAHEVNQNRTHLAPQIGLDIENFTGEEALFAERQLFLQGFEAIIKDPKWNSLYPKTQKEAQDYFDNHSNTLEEFLLEQQGFKYEMAHLSLCLLQGDEKVLTYHGSTPKHYTDVTRLDDPTKSTGLQLFVMMMRICEKKREEFIAFETENRIRTFITQTYGVSSSWNTFINDPNVQDVFESKGIEFKDTLAKTINYIKENNQEDLFFEAFKECPHHMQGVRNFVKKHQEEINNESFKDAYTPVVEVLFMLQRGHNQKLEDEKEKNRQRCAVGFFDDLMREIVNATGHFEIAKNLQIEKCE